MKNVTFEIWVAVGADGYKACIGSGMSRETARCIADEVHFHDGCYTLALVVADVPLPDADQSAGPHLVIRLPKKRKKPRK